MPPTLTTISADLLLICIVVFYANGVRYWIESCYFFFIKDKLSPNQYLEKYVSRKYHLRSSRYALLASLFTVILAYLRGWGELLGSGLTWLATFLILWLFSRRILKNSEKKLDLIKRLAG